MNNTVRNSIGNCMTIVDMQKKKAEYKKRVLHFIARSASATIALTLAHGSGSALTASLEYSYDCENWHPFSWTKDKISLNNNDIVYFRGDNDTFSNSKGSYKFVMTGTIEAAGEVTSLLDTTLKRADVPDCCFDTLFYGCTSLITAPKLPSKTIGKECYENMFYGCTSLVIAPELPSKTLERMGKSYQAMFYDCSSLSEITVHFTEWNYNTIGWVYGLAASGVFKCPPELPEEYGTDKIPSGWTVVRI